tara:strand:+ start:941 stop:1951 length:1011 start_codon:yes stop_codon:yes gene_type:complete
MEVGIFGDYNSFSTGQNILSRIWELTIDSNTNSVFRAEGGWEYLLAQKFKFCNFEVTIGQSNQEIINRLAMSIAYKPKDLYIVQTGSWYNTTTGMIDYKEEPYGVFHNLKYNIINPHSHIGKRYVQSNSPYHPNFVLKQPPGAQKEPYYDHLPSVFDVFDQDPYFVFSNPKAAVELDKDIEDKLRMEGCYGDYVKVQAKDHLGSKLKQEENFGLICNLNLLSQNHNVWYFHWEPPLGRPEDFMGLEEQHDIDPRISDTRRRNRMETLGLYTAKLEQLDSSKRIHPFSAMDWLIMTYRDDIENATDRFGYLNTTMHNFLFEQYIQSNDTLMKILANG